MLWSSHPQDDKDRRGKLARRLHELWLNRALESGRSYPRIPARKVSEGGFSLLLSTNSGRAWAERWWQDALDHVD